MILQKLLGKYNDVVRTLFSHPTMNLISDTHYM
jgi:hypothetical protein